MLPAKRHDLACPILAGFGCFSDAGTFWVNLYDVCMIQVLCDYL